MRNAIPESTNPQILQHTSIHETLRTISLGSTIANAVSFKKLSVQLAARRVSHIAREGSHDARRSPNDRIAGDLLADPVVHLTAFLHELWTCINPFNQAPAHRSLIARPASLGHPRVRRVTGNGLGENVPRSYLAFPRGSKRSRAARALSTHLQDPI